jgi:hypothetical protein
MKSYILITLVLLIPALPAWAELETGSTLPSFTVQDQHEEEYTLQPDVEYLLVSFDMSTGKAANKYLEKKGAEYLAENNAVLLANIHGMPWVGRQFALPKMRKYPHRILLADEPQETLLNEFPQKEKYVTVFKLDKNQLILSIHYWNPREGNDPLKD